MNRHAFETLNDRLRELGITSTDIAIATGKTGKIVDQSLRGRHPFIGPDLIPTPIADYLISRGVEVPAEIVAVEDGCEWNPAADAPAHCGEHHTRTVQSAVIVGSNGQWRLCESCAALPRFKRFKSRQPVRGKR